MEGILGSSLACPVCKSRLDFGTTQTACSACGRAYKHTGDLLDLRTGSSPPPSLAQRFMEARPVVAIYERTFRPVFTRLGSSVTYGDEEAYLSHFLGKVDGPVLDLGCGTGRYTRLLARQFSRQPVFGVDLSAPMLRLAMQTAAQERLSNLHFVRGNATELPFADGAFAAIVCMGALHLFPTPALALSEVARCLRPGGTFVCLTAGRVESGVGRRRQLWFSKVASFRFFTDRWLRQQLHRTGLAVQDISHWQMVVMFAARAELNGAGKRSHDGAAQPREKGVDA